MGADPRAGAVSAPGEDFRIRGDGSRCQSQGAGHPPKANRAGQRSIRSERSLERDQGGAPAACRDRPVSAKMVGNDGGLSFGGLSCPVPGGGDRRMSERRGFVRWDVLVLGLVIAASAVGGSVVWLRARWWR